MWIVAGVLGGVMLLAPPLIWVERRLLALWQDRYGPNRAGPFGLLVVLADTIKLFFKEDWIPPFADKKVFVIAPAIVMIAALMGFVVIPFAPGFIVSDLNIGILFFLATSSMGAYSIILGGWASNNKYALLGAMRGAAQMISYELPLSMFLISILILAGGFSLVALVETPRMWWEWLWLWIMFPLFFICILAETNRSPFDLPETENELVAGFQTEYGGLKFSLFMIAEYMNMITTSTIMVTLFFGGYRLPFGLLSDVLWLGPFVLAAKVIILLFLFVWVRASIGRPRTDQLMNFTWKGLLPISLGYMIITALLVLFFK